MNIIKSVNDLEIIRIQKIKDIEGTNKPIWPRLHGMYQYSVNENGFVAEIEEDIKEGCWNLTISNPNPPGAGLEQFKTKHQAICEMKRVYKKFYKPFK